MGRGYTYKCQKCGYTFTAFLGVGFMYPMLYQDTMNAARAGELGEQAMRFLEDNPDGAINPETVIAWCEKCGQYETVSELGMYVPKDKLLHIVNKGNWSVAVPCDDIEYVSDFETDYVLKEKYDHRCSACGGKMRILTEEETEKLVCPECGADMIAQSDIMWD